MSNHAVGGDVTRIAQRAAVTAMYYYYSSKNLVAAEMTQERTSLQENDDCCCCCFPRTAIVGFGALVVDRCRWWWWWSHSKEEEDRSLVRPRAAPDGPRLDLPAEERDCSQQDSRHCDWAGDVSSWLLLGTLRVAVAFQPKTKSTTASFRRQTVVVAVAVAKLPDSFWFPK